jgi:4-hydroxybenzoate polyprenyltransferase
MSHLRLVFTMLRYRASALLIGFFLLGVALHGGIQTLRWQYAAGSLALLACYIVATSLNDIFDLEVDRLNHPAAKERPLVTGAATRQRLALMAAILAALSLGLAFWVGPLALLAVVISLVVNVAYSAPPLRLCARPLYAAPVLAFAYVALPYGIGLASAGGSVTALDARAVTAFMVLFAGRMLLKDFRDRVGDAAFGKRTFLLAYGKRATLVMVFLCVIAGDAVLLTALPATVPLLIVTETYFAAIAYELYRLRRAEETAAELAAIARGARMGNAVVLTWLGYLSLEAAGAAESERAVFAVVLAAMFWAGYLLPAPAAAPATTTA